jgi:hypothetical protein
VRVQNWPCRSSRQCEVSCSRLNLLKGILSAYEESNVAGGIR